VIVVVLSKPNATKEDQPVAAVKRRILNAVIETHLRNSRFLESLGGKMLTKLGKIRLQQTL
jgi:hypothetical protein